MSALPPPSDTESQVRAIMALGLPPATVEALSVFAPLGGPFAAIAEARDRYESLVADAAANHDLLSQRGWGVVNLPMSEQAEARKLIAAGDDGAADSLLADLWDDERRTGRVVARVGSLGAADPATRAISLQRRRLLMKAHEHHHSGAFEASVPIVLAQVEGITADVTEGSMFFSKGSKAADVEDLSRLVSISAGLPAVRLAYIADVPTTQAKGSLSRHGILHGRELAYDTRVVSAKVWSLLDAVVEWAMPRAATIAQMQVDQRRADRAGSDAVNGRGQRLDDREFLQTREALRWVSGVQVGQHRNHGRFHPSVVDGWLSAGDFLKRGLPESHGVQSHVSGDGQQWWAWRKTISGWVLGMALRADDGKLFEYFYAGPAAPTASPTDASDTWGEVWGTPPDWTSLDED